MVLESDGSSATIAFNKAGRLTPMSRPAIFEQTKIVQVLIFFVLAKGELFYVLKEVSSVKQRMIWKLRIH